MKGLKDKINEPIHRLPAQSFVACGKRLDSDRISYASQPAATRKCFRHLKIYGLWLHYTSMKLVIQNSSQSNM